MIGEYEERAFRELRDANPVPPHRVAGPRTRPEADDLFESIVVRRRAPRRRTRVIVAIAAALVIALAALAAIIIRDERPAEPTVLVCFSEADVDSDRAAIPPIGDPAENCAEVWRQGAFGPGPVPPLAVCVLDTGAIAVFPGESGTTCERLGLSRASIGTNERTLAAFDQDLALAMGERCFSLEETIRIVEATIEKYGFEDWTLNRQPTVPFDANRPCGSLAVDVPTRQIYIVAIFDIWAQMPPSTSGDQLSSR